MTNMTDQIVLVMLGTLVHCKRDPFRSNEDELEDDFLEIIEDGAIVVDSNGLITFKGPRDDQMVAKWTEDDTVNVIQLKKYEMLCPGFVDVHIHAPQYGFTGTGTDRNVMEWLNKYTFPAESALKGNQGRRVSVFDKVIKKTMRHGTTTAVYFGTVDLETCKTLARLCFENGQRGFIGKVCMDRNSPDFYCDMNTDQAVRETEEFIEFVHSTFPREEAMVFPVITPRFIPTCSTELLGALGALSAKYGNCHVQSHISESLDEVEFTQALHPGEGTDTDIFERANLLHERSIMAHAVHLNQRDWDKFKHSKATIAHCPLSNFYFAHGYLPTAKLLRHGVRIGLGTDVAGGYSPSMWNAQRMAVVASLGGAIHHGVAKEREHLITYKHAFFLATLGGAECVGLNVGNFAVGKRFDAILLHPERNIDIFPETDSLGDVFEKYCNLADDRNIGKVFVNGKERRGNEKS